MEALDTLPESARTPDKPAAQCLALIANLYAVESYAQDNNLSAPERLRYRQQHSVSARVRHQIPFSPVFNPSTLTKSST